MRGDAEVSISLRRNSLWIYRRLGLDFVSGERVVPKRLLERAVPVMQRLPRWGAEAYMNDLIIAEGSRIAVVNWPRVFNIRKFRKVGLARGALAEASMIMDAMSVLGPWGVLRQYGSLLKLVNRRPFRERLRLWVERVAP